MLGKTNSTSSTGASSKIRFLYSKGNEMSALTGGWYGDNVNTNYTTSGGSLTKTDNYINLKNVINGSYGMITTNKIDLTGYTQLEAVIYKASNASDVCGITIASIFPTDQPVAQNTINSANISSNVDSPTTISLDISALDGEYRIAHGSLLNDGVFVVEIKLIE